VPAHTPSLPATGARRVSAAAITIAALAAAGGCGSLPRYPVPADLADGAVVFGMPGIRSWGDAPDEGFQQDLIRSVLDERPSDYCSDDGRCEYAAIALSGGGTRGAFGAGFLRGWEAAEGRPKFKLVTGISTGALMAPFVFLGPEYDIELERLYTSVRNRDIYRRRSVFKLGKAESLARSTPLAELIASFVDQEMVRRIAEEHARGRRLLVGTTNLDAERPMVWNMGAIAASGHPDAVGIFRSVLLASASIPVAFPPVYFHVEANGEIYDEMHVDGGVMAELFISQHIFDLQVVRQTLLTDGSAERAGSIYVIRNGQTGPEYQPVKPRIVAIAERSLTALLETVGLGDIYRVWTLARQAGLTFHFAGIPVDYELDRAVDFDPARARALFDLGYRIGFSEDRWQTSPPWISE